MVPFFPRQCSSSSKAGLTTVQLLVSETLAVVSRTRLLEVSRSKQPNEGVDGYGQFQDFFFSLQEELFDTILLCTFNVLF